MSGDVDLDLTVVVPHYGDPGPTRALVRSLAPQHASIIVVDDASPQPIGDLDGAVVIRRERNGGFGAAVNTGVTEVRTELVAILNSDLVVTDDFLESYAAAAAPFMPAVVAPQVITYDHIGASTFRFPTWRHVLAQRTAVVGRRRHHRWASNLIGEDKPRRPLDVHRVDWVSGAAMLLPTADLRAVGGFDERFHMYLEEVDLQKRLAERGVPAVYVGSVVAEHVGFASSDPTQRDRWALESWIRYADKWGWRRRLKLAVAVAGFINLATDGLRWSLGRDVHPVTEWRRRRSLVRDVWADHARLDA